MRQVGRVSSATLLLKRLGSVTSLLGGLATLGCHTGAARAPRPAAPISAQPVASAAPTPAPAPLASSIESATPELGAEPAPLSTCEEPAHAEVLPLTFTTLRSGPVTQLATGRPPKLAVRSEERVLVFEDAQWHALPSIVAEAGELEVQLFFGRDNQPRLMGTLHDGAEIAAYYRRYKGGRWQPEPSELGRLGAPAGALYGVLGYADPEVVCRPREICLVKRLSGWSTVPAHPAPVPIVLADDTAFALHPADIERLTAEGWRSLEPARDWRAPSALWVSPSGATWVTERGTHSLWILREGGWQREASAVRAPAAVWGSSDRAVWVAGENGAAFHDGARWLCVPGVNGALTYVMPLGEALLLAGPAGLWRGLPRQADANASG